MGGAITFDDGLYSIHADTTKTSVWTITDDDIYEFGDIQIDVDSADLYGSISAEYGDSNDAGKVNITPTYTADSAKRKTSVSLLFASQSHSAQILAYRALVNSRAGAPFSLSVSDAALWLTPFKDLITISSTALPLINGDYKVLQVDLQQVGCAIKLQRYDSAAYNNPTGYLV